MNWAFGRTGSTPKRDSGPLHRTGFIEDGGSVRPASTADARTGFIEPGAKAPPDDARALKIIPRGNVYSYLMFIIPVEEARSPGVLTWNKTLAFALATSSLLLQSVLLYAIFMKVVAGDVIWRTSIMGTAQSWKPFSTGAAPPTCNTGGTLCTRSNGTFTCAPPSVQLTARWDELDTNGDGVWTRQEVEASRDLLKCKYAVDPVEVFNVFVELLHKREGIIWLHPSLREGREIRKAYFTYASGDLIMCGYRNENMCANLLQMGTFDSPLRDGVAPRVGKTINSALDYCYKLLESGGLCERLLPSTYSVWRRSSEKRCQGADYSKAVYTHPRTGLTKSLLMVDYQARQDYSRVAQSYLFFTYKGIIIGLFSLAMFTEFKDILKHANWALSFPSARNNEAVYEADGKISILGISKRHRVVMAIFTIARLAVLSVLTIVGVTFLQQDTDWVNLLLNSVALVFIVEIANQLYGHLLSPSLQERLGSIEPMVLRWRWSSTPQPPLRDFLSFAGLFAMVLVIMYLHYVNVGQPMSNALSCACLSQGEECREAQRFSRAFWDDYWSVQVPGVFAEVAQLKAQQQGQGQQVTQQPLRQQQPQQQQQQPSRRMLNRPPAMALQLGAGGLVEAFQNRSL